MSLVNTFIAYQFVKILTTKWEDMPAFEHGIIDEKGKLLKKSELQRKIQLELFL